MSYESVLFQITDIRINPWKQFYLSIFLCVFVSVYLCLCVCVCVSVCMLQRASRTDLTLPPIVFLGWQATDGPLTWESPSKTLHQGCLLLLCAQQGPDPPLDRRQPLYASCPLDGHLYILPKGLGHYFAMSFWSFFPSHRPLPPHA